MKKKQADPERYLLQALAAGEDSEPSLLRHGDEADGKKALMEFAYRLDLVINQKGARHSAPIDHEYITYLYLAIDSLKLGRYCKACSFLGNAIHCTTSRPALRVIGDMLAPYLN